MSMVLETHFLIGLPAFHFSSPSLHWAARVIAADRDECDHYFSLHVEQNCTLATPTGPSSLASNYCSGSSYNSMLWTELCLPSQALPNS
jgi:hypothetical protein